MKNGAVLLLILAVLMLAAGCAQGVPQQEHEAVVAERDALQLRLAEEMEALEAARDELARLQKNPQPTAAQTPETTVLESAKVFISESGQKYHQAGCRFLKSSVEITLQEAQEQGYTPCSVCNV